MTVDEFRKLMDDELDLLTAQGEPIDAKADRVVYLLKKYDITITCSLPRVSTD